MRALEYLNKEHDDKLKYAKQENKYKKCCVCLSKFKPIGECGQKAHLCKKCIKALDN